MDSQNHSYSQDVMPEANKNIFKSFLKKGKARCQPFLSRLKFIPKFIRSKWMDFIASMILGVAISLLLLLIIYQILHFLAPDQLNNDNIELPSQLVEVPIRPTPPSPTIDADDIALSTLGETKEDRSTKSLSPAKAEHGDQAPFEYYRVKDVEIPQQTQAKIAIIITDLGLKKSKLDNVLAKAPEYTTLAFSAYSPSLPATDILNKKNFERWLTLPTESTRESHDPGNLGLYNSRDLTLNQNALTSVFNRHTAYTGLLIPPYSALPKESEQYHNIVQRIFNMGYGIVDSSFLSIDPSTLTLGRRKLPYFQADIIIDEILTSEAITANLKKLEVIAQESNSSIGIIKPYPLSIREYQEWEKTLEDRGFKIVPLSSLFKNQ